MVPILKGETGKCEFLCTKHSLSPKNKNSGLRRWPKWIKCLSLRPPRDGISHEDKQEIESVWIIGLGIKNVKLPLGMLKAQCRTMPYLQGEIFGG